MTKITDQTPEAFFYEHGAASYFPDRETLEQGKRRAAAELAAAESWLVSQPGYTVSWDEDPEPDLSWLPKSERRNRPQYVCTVTVGDETESLCGIDFGPGGHPSGEPYARVVVAEMALELMSRLS